MAKSRKLKLCVRSQPRNPKDKEMLYLNKASTTHVQSCLLLCVIPVLFYDTLCFLEVFLLCVWLPPFHQVAVLVKLSALWESTFLLCQYHSSIRTASGEKVSKEKMAGGVETNYVYYREN